MICSMKRSRRLKQSLINNLLALQTNNLDLSNLMGKAGKSAQQNDKGLNTSQQPQSKHNSAYETAKQKLQSIQYTLQSMLYQYSLQSIEKMAHIILNPQLSYLFKHTYPQFQDSRIKQTSLSQKLKKLATEHTYHEMYIYYQQFPTHIQECKQVLRYKYQFDGILRTHMNRKSIWLLCSGSQKKMKQNPNFYSQLSQYRQTYPQAFQHTISKDVVRTIQDKNKQCQQILGNILRNFAIKNPYIGYCQGMNFIVNFLMLMQFSQQQAFWITVQLLEQFLPKTYYTNMMGVAVDICIIEYYVKMHYPSMFHKITQMGLTLSLFTLQWLVCLFTSSLPFYMLVIVWDMLFIYGPSVLIKVCLVILDQLQQTILNAQDLSQLLMAIQSKKKGIFIQEDEFINRISKIYIDESLIGVCRKLVELKLMKEKVQLNQNTNQPSKAQQIECNIEWPICYKALKQHKSDTGQIQVWTFKEQGPPKINNNYLTIKNKKGYKPAQDNRSQCKKLMIGRIPHYCNVKQYNKKHVIAKHSIQLDSYGLLQKNKQLTHMLSQWTYKFYMENQHINFYQRATSQNLPFLQFSNMTIQPQKNCHQIPKSTELDLALTSIEQKRHDNSEQSTECNAKISSCNNQQRKAALRTKQSQQTALKSKQSQQTALRIKQNQQTTLRIKQNYEINEEKLQTNRSNQQEAQYKKSRNPFKKIKEKWRERKPSHTQSNLEL